MTKTEKLRALPSVDFILKDEEVTALKDSNTLVQITTWVRTAVQHCREQILENPDAFDGPPARWIIDRVVRESKSDLGQRLQPVINATGVILHTNLGRDSSFFPKPSSQTSGKCFSSGKIIFCSVGKHVEPNTN